MDKIGIIFGTDTGTTRLIAKKLAKKLGDDSAAKPININRIELEQLRSHAALILGTPTYGDGVPPGTDTGVNDGSWADVLSDLSGLDLSGKTIALYGLGNQEKYPDRFADGLYVLYAALRDTGATIVGDWPVDGYSFNQSKAVVDGRFVGLVVDNNTQSMQTEARLDEWVDRIKPALLEAIASGDVVGA